jgi:hypothetical protein
MATKVERTTPGSVNDWRLTYDTGSKKWTNDRPGDGKNENRANELEDLFGSPSVKRALKALEKGVKDFILGKGDKGIKSAVSGLENDVGEDDAKHVVRALYKAEKAEKQTDLQKKVVEGLLIAKKHANRSRKAMREQAIAEKITRSVVTAAQVPYEIIDDVMSAASQAKNTGRVLKEIGDALNAGDVGEAASLFNRAAPYQLERLPAEVIQFIRTVGKKSPVTESWKRGVLRDMGTVMAPGGRAVFEEFLTYTEGTSNKFHMFAIFEDDDGVFVGGNAYGRIGKRPRVIEVARGPRRSVERVVYDKMRKKENKGYE